MMPSPVCFTSRPPNADNASRTIVSCTPSDCKGGFVAQRLRQRCRIHNVGEQNGSDSRISFIGSATREKDRSGRICFRTAEEYFCYVGLHLDNFLGHHPVSFAMHTLCRLCVWRMCEAKNFVAILIDPVLVIFDAVFPLGFHILRVSFRDVFRSCSLRKIVNVHV